MCLRRVKVRFKLYLLYKQKVLLFISVIIIPKLWPKLFRWKIVHKIVVKRHAKRVIQRKSHLRAYFYGLHSFRAKTKKVSLKFSEIGWLFCNNRYDYKFILQLKRVILVGDFENHIRIFCNFQDTGKYRKTSFHFQFFRMDRSGFDAIYSHNRKTMASFWAPAFVGSLSMMSTVQVLTSPLLFQAKPGLILLLIIFKSLWFLFKNSVIHILHCVSP